MFDDLYLNTKEYLSFLKDNRDRDFILQEICLEIITFKTDIDFEFENPFETASRQHYRKTDEIDLIVSLRTGDAPWGIFCRYIDPDSFLTCSHIEPFIAACEAEDLGGCLIFSTTSHWEDTIELLMASTKLPVKRLFFHQFQEEGWYWCPEDVKNSWSAPTARYSPSHLELTQLIETLSCFLQKDIHRQSITHACQQDHMSLMVMEKTLPLNGIALVICGSIDRLIGTYERMNKESHRGQRNLVLCQPHELPALKDICCPTETSAAAIAKHLSRDAVKLKGIYGQDYERVTLLFCLATSVSKILNAQEIGAIHFDLIIASTLQRYFPSWLIRHIKDIAPSKMLLITQTPEYVDFRKLLIDKRHSRRK